jgi:polysulfide reductase chain C
VSQVLLALDLGKPLRFWHMLWNTTPGEPGLNFKYWSPMSVGAWALTVFGAIATVSFVEVLVRDRVIRFGLAQRAVRLLDGLAGKVLNVVGAAFGLFVAGYTGVLLSVSNQPVWSDTWALGGLFLASGLAGSAALLMLLTRFRRAARASAGMLERSERLYALLELALIVMFVLTLPTAALTEVFGFPWILLWLVAFVGLLPGFASLVTARRAVTADGAATITVARVAIAAPGLVLLGVLALRAAIIFSIQ